MGLACELTVIFASERGSLWTEKFPILGLVNWKFSNLWELVSWKFPNHSLKTPSESFDSFEPHCVTTRTKRLIFHTFFSHFVRVLTHYMYGSNDSLEFFCVVGFRAKIWAKIEAVEAKFSQNLGSCELTLLLEMGPLRTSGAAWKGGLQGRTSSYPLSRSVLPGSLSPQEKILIYPK